MTSYHINLATFSITQHQHILSGELFFYRQNASTLLENRTKKSGDATFDVAATFHGLHVPASQQPCYSSSISNRFGLSASSVTPSTSSLCLLAMFLHLSLTTMASTMSAHFLIAPSTGNSMSPK